MHLFLHKANGIPSADTPNQKNGVKINIEVKKTLTAAINGADDILAKALKIIVKKDGR